MPGTADGEEVFAVCGRRCFCIRESREGVIKKKEMREREEKKGRGGGGGGEEEMELDEKESGSREVLCLWKRGKHGDKGHRQQDKALGQEAGLIAPGTQGHWINCPWVVDTEEVLRYGDKGVTVERGWRGGEVN